jgi:hypothetical protein
MFLIGPQFNLDTKTIDMFAPKIYIKNGDKTEVYRLVVYSAYKTVIALLFKVEYVFTYKFLDSINRFLE